MKPTIKPKNKEYKSTLGFDNFQTEYGKIYSSNDGSWWHVRTNLLSPDTGESFFVYASTLYTTSREPEHYYQINL